MSELLYPKLDSLTESKTNPRKSYDENYISALALNIKEFGVIEPIVITKDNEIIAGHCRVQAARKIGFETIPAVIGNYKEEDISMIQYSENNFRMGINAIDDARHFEFLIKKLKMEVSEIADKYGIKISDINRKLQLLKLPAKFIKLHTEGDMPLSHLYIYASYPLTKEDYEELYGQITTDTTDGKDIYTIVSAKDAENELSRFMLAIENAKFDISTCAKCEHNTGNNNLFGIDFSEAVCNNAKCYKKKTKDFIESTIKSMQGKVDFINLSTSKINKWDSNLKDATTRFKDLNNKSIMEIKKEVDLPSLVIYFETDDEFKELNLYFKADDIVKIPVEFFSDEAKEKLNEKKKEKEKTKKMTKEEKEAVKKEAAEKRLNDPAYKTKKFKAELLDKLTVWAEENRNFEFKADERVFKLMVIRYFDHETIKNICKILRIEPLIEDYGNGSKGKNYKGAFLKYIDDGGNLDLVLRLKDIGTIYHAYGGITDGTASVLENQDLEKYKYEKPKYDEEETKEDEDLPVESEEDEEIENEDEEA